MRVNIHRFKGGTGQNGSWRKTDDVKFVDNESEFIKHFTSGNIPCEFIGKKAARDIRYGQEFYNEWNFKILV